MMMLCTVLLAALRVGIIRLDTSHAIAFTKIMNVTKDPGVAGFRMVAAYQWGSKGIRRPSWQFSIGSLMLRVGGRGYCSFR